MFKALRCILEDGKDIFYRPDRGTTPDRHSISLTPTSLQAIYHTGSMRHWIHDSPNELSKQHSLPSLVTPAIVLAKEDNDVCTLHQLLVWKIPECIVDTFKKVDRAGIWVGVLQEVTRNLRRK